MIKKTLLSFMLISIIFSSLYAGPRSHFGFLGITPDVQQESVLPKSYGFYLFENEKVVELKPKSVTTIIGLPLRSVNIGYAVDGIALEPEIKTISTLPIIIVYQQYVDVNQLLLCDMVYVKTMEAQQFNVKNTDKRFFSGIYSRDYYDIVDINLWRPKNEISLSIEPEEGKVGMYKFIPETTLIPGNYVFYFKGELHKDKTVFSSDFNRKASAYTFNVKSNEEKVVNVGSGEANIKRLLMEARVSITSAKNYDIRYSAAPNRTAANTNALNRLTYKQSP